MGPINNLNYLMNHVAAVMAKQSDQVLREQIGLGLSQYKILMVLEWNPRTSQKAIADALGQTEASISRQIQLLKKKGLLEAKVDLNNRRRRITTPTLKGMQITEAAVNILRRSFGQDYAGLGDDQLVQLVSGLQHLHRIVCRRGKPGACSHQLGI
jgi:DNA-binding MarR family transcriptional regulator